MRTRFPIGVGEPTFAADEALTAPPELPKRVRSFDPPSTPPLKFTERVPFVVSLKVVAEPNVTKPVKVTVPDVAELVKVVPALVRLDGPVIVRIFPPTLTVPALVIEPTVMLVPIERELVLSIEMLGAVSTYE